MPIGIITNVLATLTGSLLGLVIGSKLPQPLKTVLNNMLGIAAICMGIVLLMRQHALSAVVLSVVLGCVAGELLQLENRINTGGSKIKAGSVRRPDTCLTAVGRSGNREVCLQI